MTACEEARRELQRAEERQTHEHRVLLEYQDSLRGLVSEHSELTRAWENASSLVLENERSWEQAREVLRNAIDAKRAADEVLAHWTDQRDRLNRGESTEYTGDSNEAAIVNHKRDTASNAAHAAGQALKDAEAAVEQAKDRFERTTQFLQHEADKKFANEDAQRTLINRSSLQEQAVSDAHSWVGRAITAVDEACR